MAGNNTGKEIRLDIIGSNFIVGGSIPVKIIYKNNSRQTIAFKEPEKTWEVKLVVINGKAEANEVPFGKIFYREISEDFSRTTIEEAEMISLGTGMQYMFECDISERWPELFVPGENIVYIADKTDDTQTYKSNSATIKVVFSAESVENLLRIVENGQSSYDARLFGMNYLRKFYPDMNLILEPATDREKAKNHIMINKFKSWWEYNKNTEGVNSIIRHINTTPER